MRRFATVCGKNHANYKDERQKQRHDRAFADAVQKTLIGQCNLQASNDRLVVAKAVDNVTFTNIVRGFKHLAIVYSYQRNAEFVLHHNGNDFTIGQECFERQSNWVVGHIPDRLLQHKRLDIDNRLKFGTQLCLGSAISCQLEKAEHKQCRKQDQRNDYREEFTLHRAQTTSEKNLQATGHQSLALGLHLNTPSDRRYTNHKRL